jgi:hypothetical protein
MRRRGLAGTFHGVNETAHLHTLEGKKGGVLNLFNLTDQEQVAEAFIPAELLGTHEKLAVIGAQAFWTKEGVHIIARLNKMSPAIVMIGDAAGL